MDIIPLSELDKIQRQLIGGKSYALGQLISLGYNVPPGFCVTTLLYDQFLDQTGLRDLYYSGAESKKYGGNVLEGNLGYGFKDSQFISSDAFSCQPERNLKSPL